MNELCIHDTVFLKMVPVFQLIKKYPNFTFERQGTVSNAVYLGMSVCCKHSILKMGAVPTVSRGNIKIVE